MEGGETEGRRDRGEECLKEGETEGGETEGRRDRGRRDREEERQRG